MEILDEVLKFIPDKSKISDTSFEGANIILYTKDKDFFLDSNGILKEIVNSIKKRVELRPDPSISMDMEKTKETIEKLTPSEAGLTNILFDPPRSLVTIEAEKPGLVIGKQGDLLREIKKKTFWIPIVRRAPPIKSKIIENIRQVLYENNDYRKKFLNKIGKRIYGGWTRSKQDEWIRVSFLGAGRQVGRSCFLLQTPESRVLIDCGINVAAQGSDQYPMLEAPEFNLEQLDAVILSHPHVDHSAFIPWLYKMGYKGPVYCSVDYSEPVIIKENGIIKTVPIGEISDELIKNSNNIERLPQSNYTCAHVNRTLEVPAFDRDYKISFKPLKKVIRHDIVDNMFEIKLKTGRSIKVTGSHSIFTLNNGEVKETKVKDLSKEDYVVVPHKLPNVESIKEIDVNELLMGHNFVLNNLNMIGPNQGHKISSRIKVSQELMRILGYFVAEGHLEKRAVRFTFGLKDENIIKDLTYCIKKVFNIKVKEKLHQETRLRVSISSKVVRETFHKVFFPEYKNALSKRVPIIVFNTSIKNKIQFLRAYFAGDGYINTANKTVSAVSVSKDLISDLSYVLSQLGLTYTLFSRRIKSAMTTNLAYRITINFSEFIKGFTTKGKKSCNLIPLLKTKFNNAWYYHRLKNRKHVTKERLTQLLEKDWVVVKDNNSLLIRETLGKLANSDLSFLPIISIKKVKPTNNSVYDFSVEGDQNFIAGNAPVCLHNTEPTRDIAALLCLDTIDLAQKEASKVLYSAKDVKEMVRHTIPMEYEEVTDITPDIRITLYNAGHTLGSAVVHIHIGNGLHNLVYTGDYKFLRTELLEAAVNKFPRVETIITEATYGSKEDLLPSRKACEDEMVEIIKKTVERGGKILIPVLGVGRSQEIMLILEKVIREGLLEKIPIYVQGMVWDITAIHTAYPDYLNRNVRNSIFHKDHNPFLSDIFARVVSRKEQDDVIENSGPCVILATSGMMSVDANEQILVKNSNKLKITKVGEIIDRTISQSKKKAILVGETNGEMAIPNNNLQVPCYNFKNGKLEFKPVSVVIKHRVDKPIYKIKLKSGREVKVTGSHSVMIFKNGYITSKKVEDLTKEDNIVINKAIEQNKEGINKLNLIEKLLDNCPKKILRKIYIKNDKNAKYYTSWGKRYRTSSLFNYNKETKLSKDARIGLKAATDLTIFHKLNTSKELSRLLGYFVSEGCYYMSKFRNGDVKLAFGIHESHLVKDAANCIEKCFGVKPKILEDKNKNTLTVQFGSKLFAYIFKYALGCATGAGKKRVPSLVFNLKKDFQKEFLKGYFLGDGSLYDKNKKTTIAFTSKSKALMSDISLLLSLNDIPVHKISTIIKQRRIIKNRMVRKSTLYRIQITNPKYINKLNLLDYKIKRNRIPIEVNPFSVPVEEIKVLFNDLELNNTLKYLKWSILGRKRITYKRLNKLINVLRKTSNNKGLLGSLEKISKGYLGFDKIDVIKKTKSSNNYVYDFSIKGAENFLAGHGGVLLHNTGGASVEYFRRLADNPNNTIMFVNYLGEGSLGRRIQNNEPTVQVPGERGMEIVQVKLEVKTLTGLSGHAGRAELIRYLSTCDPKPKKIIIVHGEVSKCLDLASSIHKSAKIETSAPKNLEVIRLR